MFYIIVNLPFNQEFIFIVITQQMPHLDEKETHEEYVARHTKNKEIYGHSENAEEYHKRKVLGANIFHDKEETHEEYVARHAKNIEIYGHSENAEEYHARLAKKYRSKCNRTESNIKTFGKMETPAEYHKRKALTANQKYTKKETPAEYKARQAKNIEIYGYTETAEEYLARIGKSYERKYPCRYEIEKQYNFNSLEEETGVEV